MAPGIQSDGTYLRKSLAEITTALETVAQTEFGLDVDLSPGAPHKRFINVIAQELADMEARLDVVYNSGYADTATGKSLGRVYAVIGIPRKKAEKASGTLRFGRSVDDGSDITIPAGTRAKTGAGIEFETTEAGTLDTLTVDIPAEAVTAGASGNAAGATITTMSAPIAGVETVTNPAAFAGGQDEETDAAYRSRVRESLATAGAATTDAVRAAILGVAGVTQARVSENDSTATDGDGAPAASIKAVVQGGVDDDIAQAILGSKAVGVNSWGDGSASGSATDSSGNTVAIDFTRPTAIPIFVDVTVVGTSVDLTAVETAIIDYIGGTDDAGQVHTGLGVGDDVIFNEVVAAVMDVDGVDDATITIGESDNPTGTVNISIDDNEVARASVADVDVS